MSIAQQREIEELKRRVEALERLVSGQQHVDDMKYEAPEALKGKTLTLPEKRKSA